MKRFLAVVVLLAAPLHAQQLGQGGIIFTPPSGGGTFTGGTISTPTNVANDICLTFGTTDTTASPCIRYDTTQTVDTGMFLTGTVSNHWVMAERQDETFDFAHAQATNPTLFVHSANQSTTQWLSFTHDATNGVIDTGAGRVNIPDGVITADGTSAVNGLALAGGAGIWSTGPNLLFNTSASSPRVLINTSDLVVNAANGIGWSATTVDSTQPDIKMTRVAAGVIRTGTNSGGLGYFLTGLAVTANTATATPAIADSGRVYTNTGDSDGSTVTLPDDPTVGVELTITATAAQNITVAPSAGETVMFGNTVCATSLVVGGAATGIGDSITVIAATGGSGAVWITTGSAGTPVCTP